MWTLQDMITAFDLGVNLQKESERCMILREPQLQRFPKGNWLWYCLIQEMPAEFRVSKRLHTSHSEVLNYCATLFGKTLVVSDKDVDIDTDKGEFCKSAGFVICYDKDTPLETEEIEWMLLFHVGNTGVWRRRWIRGS